MFHVQTKRHLQQKQDAIYAILGKYDCYFSACSLTNDVIFHDVKNILDISDFALPKAQTSCNDRKSIIWWLCTFRDEHSKHFSIAVSANILHELQGYMEVVKVQKQICDFAFISDVVRFILRNVS